MTDDVAHWRDLHRRKNKHVLFAEDIGPPGTTRDFEIVESGKVKVTDQDGDHEMPWIGTGRAGAKKFGLNPTNCKTMETLTGTSDYRRWRGWITIIVIRTKYPDRKTKKMLETDALRIADVRPRRGASDVSPEASASSPTQDEPTAGAPEMSAAERAGIEREETRR